MYKGFDSRYDLVLGLSKRTNLYCTKIRVFFLLSGELCKLCTCNS